MIGKWNAEMPIGGRVFYDVDASYVMARTWVRVAGEGAGNQTPGAFVKRTLLQGGCVAFTNAEMPFLQ